ncbi:putative membrane protein (plasmid) [Sphingobium sp. RAC03]|nr:putative membrane protein [Sphingobium sp. RAC03]
MMIIDGSFLLGIAAVLTSIATLWRSLKGRK